MRHVANSVIDYSPPFPRKDEYGREVFDNHAIVVLTDEWHVVPSHRPWHHVRYHSCVPVTEHDGFHYYHTLHCFLVERLTIEERGRPYVLPHVTDDVNEQPKFFAVGLETSREERMSPSVRLPTEIGSILRKIQRRRSPSSVQRSDFLTRLPLGIDDVLDQSEKRPPLHEMEFHPIVVRDPRNMTQRAMERLRELYGPSYKSVVA